MNHRETWNCLLESSQNWQSGIFFSRQVHVARLFIYRNTQWISMGRLTVWEMIPVWKFTFCVVQEFHNVHSYQLQWFKDVQKRSLTVSGYSRTEVHVAQWFTSTTHREYRRNNWVSEEIQRTNRDTVISRLRNKLLNRVRNYLKDFKTGPHVSLHGWVE